MESWLTPLPLEGEIIVLQSPPREVMLSLVAALVMKGSVLALDVNNQFDAYRLARLVRRRTTNLYEVLGRVSVARAFTCYQAVALFEGLSPATMPHVVFDLPATFYDESVTAEESRRLLRIALGHVRRVSQVAPVVISARPSPAGPRGELLAAIVQMADRLLTWDEPAVTVQPRLFS